MGDPDQTPRGGGQPSSAAPATEGLSPGQLDVVALITTLGQHGSVRWHVLEDDSGTWKEKSVDEEHVERQRAAEALGKLGDDRAVLPLIAALGDPKHNVRRAAATAHGLLGDHRAVQPLVHVFGAGVKDSSREGYAALEAMAKALGLLGDRRACGVLLRYLQDFPSQPNWSWRGIYIAVIEALGTLGDPRAVGPITARLGYPDHVGEAAAAALRKIEEARGRNSLGSRLANSIRGVVGRR